MTISIYIAIGAALISVISVILTWRMFRHKRKFDAAEKRRELESALFKCRENISEHEIKFVNFKIMGEY